MNTPKRKERPKSSFWDVLGCFGGHSGWIWSDLGMFWGDLGTFWGDVGDLGALWCDLRAVWERSGVIGDILV